MSVEEKSAILRGVMGSDDVDDLARVVGAESDKFRSRGRDSADLC